MNEFEICKKAYNLNLHLMPNIPNKTFPSMHIV